MSAPRFLQTYCSQCGCELGPGNAVVSSCEDHHNQRRAMSYRIKDEPRKLADVMRGMLECGSSPDDLWQTEQPDGDP